jgi:hypothetical protein
VVRKELRTASAALFFEFCKETRHFDGIVAGFRHYPCAKKVRICFSTAREFQQHRVGPQSDAKLRELAEHRAVLAEHAAGQHDRKLYQIGLGGLIRAVPQRHVRDLMRQHAGELRLIISGDDQSGMNE